MELQNPMTLPNADSLDPATIRVMCAEEMGWKRISPDNPCSVWPMKEYVTGEHGLAMMSTTSSTVATSPPDYTESADAALGLVEKMEAEGYKSQWHEHVWTFYKPMEAHAATAPTLALAICLAFLKATGRAL